MDCLSDRTDQVVVLERWPGREVRSWVAFPEGAARGPLDDRLSPILFFSSHVVGLGVCSSGADPGGQRSAARILDVQSMITTGDGPVLVDLGVPDPITRALGGPDAALLYGPPLAIPPWASVARPPKTSAPATQPPATAATSATWPTGSYAIAFSFASDATGVVRWLRIDLIHGAGPSG